MGALVEAERVSRTVIKPAAGFHAELPGLDLATLIQMTCARRERLVVRVSSYGEEGYLYSADGALLHATVGTLVGDEAVLRMLAWPTGEFSLCERPFPLRPTIETSTEGLLLRAAQRVDQAALDRETDLVLGEEIKPELSLADQLEGRDEDEPPASTFLPYAPLPELTLPRAPADLDPVIEGPARRSSVPPAPVTRTTSLPLPAVDPGTRTWPIALPTPPVVLPTLANLLQARAPNEGDDLALTTPVRRQLDPSADATPVRPPAPPRPPSRSLQARDSLPPVSLGRLSEPPPRISEPPRRRSDPPPASPARTPLPASATNVALPRPIERLRDSQPPPEAAARRPPPPPVPSRRAALSSIPDIGSAVLASVRLDARGEVVGTFGSDEQLAQLVAYVNRIAALVQADFALDPFDALHAELAGKRVLVFRDGAELVGLVMKPSGAAQELRQRLGV